MGDDRLRQLLRRADDAYFPVTGAPGLGAKVRQTDSRRRQARIAFTILMPLAAAALWHVSRRDGSHSPPVVVQTPRSKTSSIRAELARLKSDARVHEAVAERLASNEVQHRANGVRDVLASLDPTLSLDRELARTALLTLTRGDDLLKRGMDDQAKDEYRTIVRLFPQTHWASVANSRLEQLEN